MTERREAWFPSFIFLSRYLKGGLWLGGGCPQTGLAGSEKSQKVVQGHW